MRLFPTLLALSLATSAAAQHNTTSSGHAMTTPQETGQSAFAALAEIVALLRADPKTDWGVVDIAALRRHLVDMNLVTTETMVARSFLPSGVRFDIRGTARDFEAIRASQLVQTFHHQIDQTSLQSHCSLQMSKAQMLGLLVQFQ